uniref:Caspase a n=1 Tax=Sparus aurata TaxID=8175 RepID=A0A671UY74_SPAAU
MAELTRVRSDFVGSVSKAVIKLLLDDMLDDAILNDGEKESILEENPARADQARDLIDTVKKKGDDASRKFIERIKNRDNSLFSKLGLSCEEQGSCDQPAPAAAEPQKEEEWSDSLIPVKESFWSEKQIKKNIYPAARNSIKSRVALLITNIEFTDKSHNRRGAEKDEENMEKLLTGLGYEVVKHTNLTAKAIDAAIKKFSEHPKLEETDSVVVVIMSHGKLGAVLGVDWKKETSGDEKPDEFPINDIYKHLGPGKCKALLDKPKIIIIQACRGGECGSVLVSDDASAADCCDDVKQPDPFPPADEENLDEDNVKIVHSEKDFISLLSSTPDAVSYRHSVKGSLLIQYVVDVFNTYAHQDHIHELFRKIMERFEGLAIQHKRQMPTIDRCTLTKHFYFFPAL